MNPKKHSEFKEDIASELGLHQNVVNDFISYYYSQLRKELSNFEYLCDTMARCFVSPNFVIEFYHRLSDKLNNEIKVYAGLDYD